MKVALFANGWNAENVDNFIDGFNEFFSNGDTDLFVFTSYSGSVESIERNEAEDSIYSLPDMSFFDAAIIFGSGIKDTNKIPQIIDRCKEANVPVIVQGIKVDGVSTVTIDNYIGMKKTMCSFN